MSSTSRPTLKTALAGLAVLVVLVTAFPALAAAEPPAARSSARLVVAVTDKREMKDVRARIEAAGGTVSKRYGWGGYLVTFPDDGAKERFRGVASAFPGVKYVTEDALVHATGTVTELGTSAFDPSAPASLGQRSVLPGSWLGAASAGSVSAEWVPNDPGYPLQWDLQRIGGPVAWDTARGAGVWVAVIDSGVDYTHPDLAGAVYLGPDFVDGDMNPMDLNGHGTAMAGIIGAWANNSRYGASVAPDAPLLAIRVLNSAGLGSAADVADAIIWAADAGVPVLNLSLGGQQPGMTPVIDAVAYARSKGALIVGASGNMPASPETATLYPAAAPGVIGAGATTSLTPDTVWPQEVHGLRADGSPVVTVGAPGDYIFVILPGPAMGRASGTSCATAEISGAAAVVWSAYPDATADDIASILASSALDIGAPGRDVEAGWGRIRLNAAVTWVASDAFIPRAPTALGAVSGAPGPAVDLAWTDNAASEAGFQVERAQDTSAPAAFSRIATLGPDATTYHDATGLDWTSTWYYRVRAYNATGPSAWTNVAGVRLDTGPPVSTLLINGAPPAGGWYTTATTATVTATDTPAGVQDIWVAWRGAPEVYTGPFALPEGTTPITYRAVDRAGNAETSRTATVSVDALPPVVSSDATSAQYGYMATITIDAVDAGSGVAQIAYRADGGVETSGSVVALGVGVHTLYYRARDNVGHWSDEVGPLTITVVDAPAPASGIALAPQTPAPAIRVTWVDNSSDETGFRLERARDSSASAAFSLVTTLGANVTSYDDATVDWGSTWYYRVRAFNAADPSAYSTSTGLKLDTTAPASALYVNGLAPIVGWYNAAMAPVVVSMQATDTQSGVASISFDRGSGPETYTGTFTLAEGVRRISLWSIDNAANTEASHATTVSVDLTAPDVSSDATTAPYNGTATVRITAVDPLSGVGAVSYRIDGGSETSGAVATVPSGTHRIESRARDVAGNWSAWSAATTVTVRPTLTVYRFFNKRTGTHFYTGSETERNDVIARLGTIYTYEGAAYTALADRTGGAVPLYRFFNKRNGTHFYTASETERANVQATLGATYAFEGPAYYVLPSAGPSTRTVYRFYQGKIGAHFYTASDDERASVQANLGWLYSFEGAAFYVPR